MKNVKIDILNLDYNKPINYYCKIYELSENALRNRFKKLGIYSNFIYTTGNTSKIKSKLLEEEYNKNPKKCPLCNLVISFNKKENTYCSIKCASFFTQKDGGHHHWSEENKKKISEWAKKYAYKVPNELKNNIFHKKEKIKLVCKTCHNDFYVHLCEKNRHFCNRKCYDEYPDKGILLTKKTGGYRKNSGRGKMGWYKGYFCQSSWELAWVIYQLDHRVKFERNIMGFEYEFKGNNHKFYPDFILEDDSYVEIKGWPSELTNSKISQFPYKLKILHKNDMKPYLNYVIDKYGKSFISLYENNLSQSDSTSKVLVL